MQRNKRIGELYIMKSLDYGNPKGGRIKNPSKEFLLSEIRKDGAYWAQGSGDSGLHLHDTYSSLIFFKDGSRGTFIMDLGTYKAPCYSDIEPEPVRHSVGGSIMITPSCCYMNQSDAERIILHYAETGEFENFENWKDIYDIIPYNEEEL